MRAGRLSSVVLVLIVTLLATAARALAFHAMQIEATPTLKSTMVFIGVVGIVTAMVLVPIGFMLDRAIAKLQRNIESAALQDSAVTTPDSKWLRPVTRALIGAVDQFRQREQALRAQLGDLEIRHRVSEAQRRQIEAVLHALRDAVVVTDGFNELVMSNAAAATILGFDRDKDMHKPIDEVLRDEKLRQMIRDARNAADFKNARHVEHTVSVVANGEQRVFDVALACVENHRHEVGGVVTILHDLTREREVSQMKSDFVSKASHELRTPLSSIRAYVEMLVDGEAADEKARHEFYRIIQGETDRLGRLIDNMLNISRIEAGIVQIERGIVDIKAIVDRAVSTIQPQARDKNINLSARLSAVDLSVEGDADMLYQVVLNLVSNAVKYTPDGGRVTVGGDSDNLTRSVLVTISDTGLGIPPDALPKLFDKFFRIENYKRVAKGTGLGLSLCKHIVETVHHGQIGVESKLGMGSKFWFSVPVKYAGKSAEHFAAAKHDAAKARAAA